MPVKYNSDTREAVRLNDAGDAWELTKTMTNPDGSVMALDGTEWKPVGKAPQEEEPAGADPDTFANNLRQLLGQGLALGFGDEIEGAVRGAYESVTTDAPIKQAMGRSIDLIREQNRAFEKEFPLRSLGLQVAGGALTGGLGAARAGALRTAGIGRKALTGAKIGGVTGAAAGAGFGEGGPVERIPGAAVGGTAGLGLGAVAPLVGPGLAKAAAPIGRILPGGAKRQAKGWLRTAAREDELTGEAAEGALRDMPPEAVLADVGGESMRDLARWSGTKFGGKKAAQMLKERQEGQGYRVSEAIDERLSKTALVDFLEDVGRKRQRDAQKQYGSVYDTEVPLTDELKNLLENKRFQKFYAKAKALAEYDGIDLPDPFTKTEAGAIFARPSMRTLDYIKQAMDDRVGALYKAGHGTEAGKAKALRNRLRDHLDEVVPEYKDARSVYAGHSAAMDAAELGDRFIMSPKKISTRQLNDMGAHEREAFRVGVADALRYKVMSAPDAADVTKRIFGNKLARKRLESVFETPEDFAKFRLSIENEVKMFETQARVRLGSRTAPMLEDVKTFEKPAALVGDVLHAARGTPLGFTQALGGLLSRVKAPPEAVAKHLTGMLLSPDPAAKIAAIKIMQGGQSFPRRAGSLLSGAAGRYGAPGASGLLGATPYNPFMPP